MTAPDHQEIELALISAALSGDAGGLYRVVSGLMEQGVALDSLLFDYLLPTEASVGQRWAQADYSVADEHISTATIETVISLLIGMFEQPTEGPLTVVTTAHGDDHSLPARAVSAHLVFLGHRTAFLGSNIPVADIEDYLSAESASVLVMSVAMASHLMGARAVVEAAHAAGVPVVAGGKGLGPEGRWTETVGADAYAETPGHVSGVVERWIEGGPPTLVETPHLPPTVVELTKNRSSVMASIESSLVGADPRLISEASLLLATVEASVLAGDDRALSDMVEWQRTTLSLHGLDSGRVESSVVSALSPISSAAETLQRVLASTSR